jgi:hypothetical protein
MTDFSRFVQYDLTAGPEGRVAPTDACRAPDRERGNGSREGSRDTGPGDSSSPGRFSRNASKTAVKHG